MTSTLRESSVRILTGEASRQFPLEALRETLTEIARSPGPLTWLHASLDPAILDLLDETLVHELAMKSLRGGPERARVEEYSDHLYLSLFYAAKEGEDEPSQDLRVFLGSDWLLTLADFSPGDYEVLGERVKRQVFEKGRGPGHMLYVLCDWAVESLVPVIEGLDQAVDSLEDQVIARPDQEVVANVFRVKRRTSYLRRSIGPLRDVMQRLSTQDLDFVEEAAQVFFRDLHDDTLRLIEELDALREITASSLELYQSSISNRLNAVMKRLTLVATLFMPITFITGFFGMNFNILPFDSAAWFYAMVTSVLASVLVMLLFFRGEDRR